MRPKKRMRLRSQRAQAPPVDSPLGNAVDVSSSTQVSCTNNPPIDYDQLAAAILRQQQALTPSSASANNIVSQATPSTSQVVPSASRTSSTSSSDPSSLNLENTLQQLFSDSENKANLEDCTTNAPIGKLPNQNYDIFTQLIDIARKSLQIYFDKIFPSKDVVSIFTKNKVDMKYGQYKFNKHHLDILFPANGTSPSSSAFDVTIMYKLLRNFGPNVQDPLVGWGNKPEVGKKSETDDVERIRYYRNMVVHGTDKTMEQEDLDIFWKDLSQAIMRLSSGTLEKEIQALKMQK